MYVTLIAIDWQQLRRVDQSMPRGGLEHIDSRCKDELMETNVLEVPPANLEVEDIKKITLNPELQNSYYKRWNYWVEHLTIEIHMGLFQPPR